MGREKTGDESCCFEDRNQKGRGGENISEDERTKNPRGRSPTIKTAKKEGGGRRYSKDEKIVSP